MAATLTIILKQSNFSLQHYGGTLQLSHTSDWGPNNGRKMRKQQPGVQMLRLS
uniref:Uncharacterized protein n=1 Tax=Zea mays TaxID=4577 RepID=C4IZZ6_MAIZE|nr:unknown [Zea mays]